MEVNFLGVFKDSSWGLFLQRHSGISIYKLNPKILNIFSVSVLIYNVTCWVGRYIWGLECSYSPT